jgi:hypothetical protein
VLTWAGLAGDCALLDGLARAGQLRAVRVLFIDTLHLFPETHALLAACESRYGFKALRYAPQGADTKAEWNKRYASDLYMTDPERYDEARERSAAQRNGAARSRAQARAQRACVRVLTRVRACVLCGWQLAKVEPLQRALAELRCDAWINGACACCTPSLPRDAMRCVISRRTALTLPACLPPRQGGGATRARTAPRCRCSRAQRRPPA